MPRPAWVKGLTKSALIEVESIEDQGKAKRMVWARDENLTPIRAWMVEEARGEDGELRAVMICSALLEAHLWMILDRSFEPKDNLAVYYAEEIPLLKGKSLEDLKLIHKTKLIFRGCRVVQEGPDSAPAEEPQQGDLKLRAG